MTSSAERKVPDGVLAARQALEGPRERIDGIFVAAGAELIACVDSLQRVTRLFNSLPLTIDGPMLTQAAAKIGAVSRRAAEIADGMTGGSGDLGQLMQALSKAAGPIDQLLRIMKTMAMVSINARVAAAGLGTSATDVGIFWQDMGDLAKSANGVVAQIAERYEALSATVSQAALARTRFLTMQREPLRRISRSLADRLAAVDRQRNDALKASTGTGDTVRGIAERVASTVTAMQSGDAARQRMDHIEFALAKLSEEELPEGVVSIVAALQSRQLDAARQDLARETDIATRSVTALMSDVQALLQTARKSALSSDRDTALAALEAAARQSADALKRCEIDRQSLDAMAGNVVRTVEELLQLASRLEELEHQTRLVSLNAAIRCAHLGERGRALTVIAQQLRDLTAETSVSTTEAVAALRNAAAASSQISAEGGAGLALGTSELEDDITIALDTIRGIGGALAEAHAGLERETPLVHGRLREVLALLEGCEVIIGGLEDAEGALSDIPGTEAAAAPEGFDELFRMLRKSYSLEAERHIHDELIGQQEPSVPDGTAAEDPLDAMLF